MKRQVKSEKLKRVQETFKQAMLEAKGKSKEERARILKQKMAEMKK